MFSYNNPLFFELLEKKVLNRNLYSKFFVRHSFIEKHGCKNSLVVVDNSLSLGIVDLNIKYLQANHFRKLNFEKGYSILLENFLYSKKQIQFNYYLLNSKWKSLILIFSKSNIKIKFLMFIDKNKKNIIVNFMLILNIYIFFLL